MKTVLTISSLSKNYGRIHAVKNISLQVAKGSVFGILGPNGSGKTTTLGMVLGVIRHASGSFEWFGKKICGESLIRIGTILEQPNYYPYLSAVNNLKIVADIKGVPHSQINLVLNRVNLYERRNDAVKKYSLGMKQRLALAAALLSNPEVLVLDEPTNGLDPQGIADVRQIIRRVSEQGTTIILASHLLDEVEKVCSHVAVLKAGEVLVSGGVNDVMKEQGIVEVSADDLSSLAEAMNQLPYLKDIKTHQNGSLRYTASLTESISGSRICRDLYEKGIPLSHLEIKKQSLESYFLEITQSKN